MKKNGKAKKVAIVCSNRCCQCSCIRCRGGFLLFRQPSQTAVKDEPTHLVVAKEGSVASSVLLVRDSNSKK